MFDLFALSSQTSRPGGALSNDRSEGIAEAFSPDEGSLVVLQEIHQLAIFNHLTHTSR
jgi:hypothetical protein